MTEALFYDKKGQEVLCRLCPHNCTITPNRKGFCGVRKNREGKLYALNYGRIISAACDPIEKKPLYHFHPGTQAYSLGGLGCNLTCRHCQNHEISQKRDDYSLSQMYEMSPKQIVNNAVENGCKTIAWTYNEPTLWYEYILTTSLLAKKSGIKTALITNGVINREALEYILPHIDAYRVDVKGFSNEFYKKLTGFPFLNRVLENAEMAFEKGCHVELVTNIIPHWNDDETHIDRMINWIKTKLNDEIPWHITAYHPAYHLQEESTSRELLEEIYHRAKKSGLKHIYLGNVYSSLGSDTNCPHCGKALIERNAMSLENNILKNRCCPDCGYMLKVFQ